MLLQHLVLLVLQSAISGDLLSAVISIRYIFGFRKDNPNVFNSLIQSGSSTLNRGTVRLQ
jgi:hypothetical protein